MSNLEPIEVQGVPVPAFLYGTAWKEARTADLVRQALDAGFTGIDTANQRRHYHEAAVGEALAAWRETGNATVFLQTKFTHVEGQDHRLPYDRDAGVADQVQQSFESSLEHLGVDRLNSYLLHGPRTRQGWSADDRRVWATLESLKRSGRVDLIGVSNVSPDQLAQLCEFAEIAPAFVQNRCYAQLGWDREVRAVCRERGVVYQGFSLLTANPMVLHSSQLAATAQRHERTPAQVVFRFAHQLGMICLTGTTDLGHMEEDLGVADFSLADDEVALIERLAG